MPQNIQDMMDDFSYLDDWEDRYMHVIELGKSLAPLSDEERNANTKVNGCVSQVWLVLNVEKDGDNNPVLNFRGDSDAHIVKGLVAVVLTVFSGRTAQEIVDIDAAAILSGLGLEEHLTPQRSNGLHAMIGRIKRDAAALLT
ncbi:MAG: cysteine desulfuration protein SufE [Robiginitomaculum sp.]|nr:MAG: cysteine desulfuration protein SufE [Robiginitomaculum sp.]PHQ67030.1 MAG: cysteine desulfuration protein SufE [Robiginitomaculum sp.]